ncbi:MAG TPA: HDIG domain-containing protein [Thermotogota bacterium]|nr:HDIG domain-containing protein [Thermotogota bacterium]HPR97325.1 HDIG domain-containing protein [Thermotogota bacterium]
MNRQKSRTVNQNDKDKDRERNSLTFYKGFEKLENAFQFIVNAKTDPFLVSLLLSLLSTIFFWEWDFKRFFFIFTLLLLLELVVCESVIKKVRFFQIHKQYGRTFYMLLLIAGFINIIAGRYIGYQAITPFFGVSLITILLGKKAGQISSIFFAALLIILFPSHAAYAIFMIIVGYLTANITSDVDRRIELTFYALIISLVKLCGYMILVLSGFEMFSVQSLMLVSITPIVSTILVIGILPYVEWISRIYSNIGMLELGNLNHTLLKELMQKAPGTYFHSFMLSNLSESAAEKIGVNPILARVGAYFHDIGKTKKPEFFTENQTDDNPHNRLKPSMSYLVLMEHVKFGVEIANKYRLPILFEDLIVQHHGTRTQKYFYMKAKNENPDTTEDQYRYAGPKPQFKEAGILMLADSCEAAVKSLDNLSPQKVQELVGDIVNGIYLERELDESGLTLKDIEEIVQEFTRVIVKAYHKRIAYPKNPDEIKEEGPITIKK